MTFWAAAAKAVVLVAFLTGSARPQCLSPDDSVGQAASVDLSAIQDFTLDLFKVIVPRERRLNFVFSSYSVWNALAIAYLGSAGETQLQFERLLRVDGKVATIRRLRELELRYRTRKETSVDNTFIIANRIYFDTSIVLKDCMRNILHNEVAQLDFKNNPMSAAEAINSFARETTRGKINELVTSNNVQNAALVLINAAYFKGTWRSPFDANRTADLPFHDFDNHTVNVPTMFQFGDFKYSYDDVDGYEVLELPYVGNNLAMIIFKPYINNLDHFNRMVDSLDSRKIDQLISKVVETKMIVYLPKFSISTIVEDDLLKAISNLGLKDAFSDKADFSSFSFSQGMKLDSGVHKAFVSVDEEGTEAGAATAFVANKIGGTSEFRCDRPFVFAIRDHLTKNVLFTGAYKFPHQDASSESALQPRAPARAAAAESPSAVVHDSKAAAPLPAPAKPGAAKVGGSPDRFIPINFKTDEDRS